MSNTNKIEQEAAAWTARHIAGDLSEKEREDFKAWLQRGPEHARIFEEYVAIDEAIEDHRQDILADTYEAELFALADEQEARRGNRFAMFSRLAAASVFAAAAIGVFFTVQSPTTTPQSFATARGERESIPLEDGSSIMLNTDSAVDVTYARDRREVRLADGEALFSVSRDPERPFVVDTQFGEVTVTGTVFSVTSNSTATTVRVVSGAVDVTPAGDARVTLLAGQSVAINSLGEASDVVTFDPNTALAWREDKARYRATPLAAVVADLNRYFERPIVLGDPMLAELAVTGEFDTNDQQTVLNALGVAFSLRSIEEPHRIVLEKE